MVEAGLLARHKEASWVLFRLADHKLASALAQMIPSDDPILQADAARLADVKAKRVARAQAYFSANASNWDRLRQLHVREEEVESGLKRLAGAGPFASLIDLGTGTGRMLEIFAPLAQKVLGIDLSHEMLAIARARLSGLGHVQVRHGDISDIAGADLAEAQADLVILHQVLHFLDDPKEALLQARRLLKPGGRLIIADFAPHEREELRDEHAHRRLGIDSAQMAEWLGHAGLKLAMQEDLPPPANLEDGLTVSLWLAVA
jgi:SAM-dependent methyltransferase